MTAQPASAAPPADSTPAAALAAADFAALTAEACQLWQDYLTRASADPATRVALEKLSADPQALMQQWFAAFPAMRQAAGDDPTGAPAPDSARPATGTPTAAARPAAAGAASDDGALRLAQLALRINALEQRVAELESDRPFSVPAARAANR